jgi:hypothetical protein
MDGGWCWDAWVRKKGTQTPRVTWLGVRESFLCSKRGLGGIKGRTSLVWGEGAVWQDSPTPKPKQILWEGGERKVGPELGIGWSWGDRTETVGADRLLRGHMTAAPAPPRPAPAPCPARGAGWEETGKVLKATGPRGGPASEWGAARPAATLGRPESGGPRRPESPAPLPPRVSWGQTREGPGRARASERVAPQWRPRQLLRAGLVRAVGCVPRGPRLLAGGGRSAAPRTWSRWRRSAGGGCAGGTVHLAVGALTKSRGAPFGLAQAVPPFGEAYGVPSASPPSFLPSCLSPRGPLGTWWPLE